VTDHSYSPDSIEAAADELVVAAAALADDWVAAVLETDELRYLQTVPDRLYSYVKDACPGSE
jgi:hypothetical protein